MIEIKFNQLLIYICKGTSKIQRDLEKELANFLGVESTVVFGMGFATNATNIPNLVGKVKNTNQLFII
jgi:7-keto-8-aminopelargonate synthetase-like enzyme